MAADTAPRVDPARIVEELRELRARRATGTYYVLSDDNRQGRISFADGEIHAASLRGVEGLGAIAAMAMLHVIRTRFAADGLRPGGGGPLDSEAVYRALLGQAPAAPASPPAPGEAAAGPRVMDLSPTAQQAIRQALTNFLGPIADLVFEEHRRPDLPVETLLARLAGEIPDSRRAGEFLALARQRLQQAG